MVLWPPGLTRMTASQLPPLRGQEVPTPSQVPQELPGIGTSPPEAPIPSPLGPEIPLPSPTASNGAPPGARNPLPPLPPREP